MKLGILIGLAAVLVPTATGSAGAAYSAKATAACLTGQHVLTSDEPRPWVLPPGLPAVGVLQFSLALIPGQALDNGSIVFERDPATATRVAERWFRYDLAQAAKVKGVDLSKLKIQLSDVFTVKKNTITVWRNQPVKPASLRLVSRCLR